MSLIFFQLIARQSNRLSQQQFPLWAYTIYWICLEKVNLLWVLGIIIPLLYILLKHHFYQNIFFLHNQVVDGRWATHHHKQKLEAIKCVHITQTKHEKDTPLTANGEAHVANKLQKTECYVNLELLYSTQEINNEKKVNKLNNQREQLHDKISSAK